MIMLSDAATSVEAVVSSPKVFNQAPHMSPYWLVYRHNNQISVVIEPGASLIHARMRAALANLADGLLARWGNSYHPSLFADFEGNDMKIDGRCHCGYVRFEAEADPETTTICNCTDCQTMSGAPLRAIVATRPGTFVLLSGKPTEYRKTADSGNVRLQTFCPHCGTPIYATSTGDEPKAYNVRLGSSPVDVA